MANDLGEPFDGEISNAFQDQTVADSDVRNNDLTQMNGAQEQTVRNDMALLHPLIDSEIGFLEYPERRMKIGPPRTADS